MSKRPIGYFEADGSYNERPAPPKPKPDESFRLFFDRPVAPQLEGKLKTCAIESIAAMVAAYHVLERGGILPGNRARAAERQIDMKVDRMIRKFAKQNS